MSLSPARQHRLRVQAEQAAREGGSVRHASGYDLMLLQLAEDRRRLKGVQSTVKKAEIKVELLPKYAAWAEGVLAAGGAQQDDVLMYVMLWRIDAGDYAGALEIGRHALRHGWVMPLGNRNVQTVLAEEMADAAQSAMLAATGFDVDLLLQTLELTDGLDMPDQSRARLHKAIGAVLSESKRSRAITWWVRMKTCWYLIAPMPTGATLNGQRKCSGNVCNAALRHSRYNWRKGGQISTRKCL